MRFVVLRLLSLPMQAWLGFGARVSPSPNPNPGPNASPNPNPNPKPNPYPYPNPTPKQGGDAFARCRTEAFRLLLAVLAHDGADAACPQGKG